MSNFINNFNQFIDYYFYNNNFIDQILIPLVVVVVAFILIRFFISWFFSIGTRVRSVKKLSKGIEDLDVTSKKQLKILEEQYKEMVKLNKNIDTLIKENRSLINTLNSKDTTTKIPVYTPEQLGKAVRGDDKIKDDISNEKSQKDANDNQK